MADRTASPRFHGRVPGTRSCANPGCTEAGEFRAPGERRPGFDGPGAWQWLCLDHVREFNARYNFFAGMSADEIAEAQAPYGGWERETRAFSSVGADAPPAWSDFRDPMDALGARFRRSREQPRKSVGEEPPEIQAALKTLGLEPGADLRAIRRAYSTLVRRYHPDRNGGDRSEETRLAEVIAAYQRLRATFR